MKSHEDVLRLQLRFYSRNKLKSERMNTRYARPGLVKVLSSDTSCLIRSHVPQNRILSFPTVTVIAVDLFGLCSYPLQCVSSYTLEAFLQGSTIGRSGITRPLDWSVSLEYCVRSQRA